MSEPFPFDPPPPPRLTPARAVWITLAVIALVLAALALYVALAG